MARNSRLPSCSGSRPPRSDTDTFGPGGQEAVLEDAPQIMQRELLTLASCASNHLGWRSLIYVVRWRQRTVQGGGSLTSKRLATLAHRRSLSSGDFWPALFISCLMPSRHRFGGSRK